MKHTKKRKPDAKRRVHAMSKVYSKYRKGVCFEAVQKAKLPYRRTVLRKGC